MDINAPDFNERFNVADAVVGVIGQGFVGNAMAKYFEGKIEVVKYDKYKSEFSTLQDVVKRSDIIFVCVPTPMRKNGECYTGIVEDVLEDIVKTAIEIGRPFNTFIVVIKSTISLGFTELMREEKPLRICFSPEFLTEKNAVEDMKNANRIVVGGDDDDAGVVLRFFLGVEKDRVDSGRCTLVQCSPTVAEMAKLYTNGLLFTKVMFSNEIYAMCDKLKIPYDEVRFVACMDPRLGWSHTVVPGPDGQLGAGGHCFPKDMHNLKFEAAKLGVTEKIFTAVIDRNAEVRQDKDWEKMSDRAVTEK